MNLSTIKSIEKSTNKELLLIILSTQLQLVRRIEFLEKKITKKELESVDEMCADITNKFDDFIKKLDEAIKRKQ